MSYYNSRGNINVVTSDTTGKGLFSADGEVRVTVVSGSAWTGLYAADGSVNVVVVTSSATPLGLYHPCGAWRVVEASSEIGQFAPNGAYYVSGTFVLSDTEAKDLMGSELNGLTFSANDQSMAILDTTTPANNYDGELSAKLGSIRTSAGMTYLSSGLLGWGPENGLVRSQEFDNASWAKADATVTANTSAGADGTITADTVVFGAAGAFANVRQSVFSVFRDGNVVNFSVYLSGSGTIHLDAAGASNNAAVTLTSTLTRYSVQLTITATGSFTPRIISYGGDTATTFVAWGAQVERAASASTYKPTTSAAYYGLRLDYDTRLTGGPGYLVEEARTNSALQSQTFGTTWTQSRATITSDATTAPDGSTTADKIVQDATAASDHRIFQAVTTTAAAWTFSVYAKQAENTWIALRLDDSGGTGRYAYFNLATGAVGATPGTGITQSIQAVANGWYRCVTTIATAFAGSSNPLISIAEADNDATFDGNGTSGLYIWGAQLEAGAFATSYIPTTTATVTRAVDTGGALTALPISSTEGTLVGRFAAMGAHASATARVLELSDGTINERVLIFRNPALTMGFTVTDGGAAQVGLTSSATVANLTLSGSAGAYKLNDSAVVQAGESVATDGTCTMPTVTTMHFGNRADNAAPLNGWLRHGRYFPTRKSNADLAVLAAAA